MKFEDLTKAEMIVKYEILRDRSAAQHFKIESLRKKIEQLEDTKIFLLRKVENLKARLSTAVGATTKEGSASIKKD